MAELWIPYRSRDSRHCATCGKGFGIGSAIEWNRVTKQVRCGLCARGRDRAYERLQESEKAMVQSQVDVLSRLQSLPRPLSRNSDLELQSALTLLQPYGKLRVVRDAIARM